MLIISPTEVVEDYERGVENALVTPKRSMKRPVGRRLAYTFTDTLGNQLTLAWRGYTLRCWLDS